MRSARQPWLRRRLPAYGAGVVGALLTGCPSTRPPAPAPTTPARAHGEGSDSPSAPPGPSRFGGITLGREHACVWTREGEVVCWGNNRYRELGLGLGSGRCPPIVSTVASGVVEVVAGERYTCARDDAGQVVCWGSAWSEQPRSPAGVHAIELPSPAVALAGARRSACALTRDRQVWCWGARYDGLLAHDPPAREGTPVVIAGIDDARTLAISDAAGCVVEGQGALRCWGAIRDLVEDPPSDRWTFGPTTLQGPAVRPVLAMLDDAPCAPRRDDDELVCWLRSPTDDPTAPAPAREVGVAGAARLFGSDPRQGACALLGCGSSECEAGPLQCFRPVDAVTHQGVAGLWPGYPASPDLRPRAELRALALAPSPPRPADPLGCAIDLDDRVLCWTADGTALFRDELAAVTRGAWADRATRVCRDIDSDGDGPSDENDRCPADPEVYNGKADEDGCPDEGESWVEVDELGGQIRLLRKVRFRLGSDFLSPESFALLEQVVAVLEAYPRFRVVEIQGHEADRSADAYGRKPTQRRADAVREFLVSRGVDPARLDSRGYGSTRPLVPNDSREHRAINDRIEIHVLELGD